ncbi:hypothetical protein DOY81_009523 [Sarcophaga bullata]|nr:hypothetical protein DOY81_009523 [Sarcophaga bullata]
MSSTIRFYSKLTKEFYPNSKVKIFRKANGSVNSEKITKTKKEFKRTTTNPVKITNDQLVIGNNKVTSKQINLQTTAKSHLKIIDSETIEPNEIFFETTDHLKQQNEASDEEKSSKTNVVSPEYNENLVKIQLLSENLHQQLFNGANRFANAKTEHESLKIKNDLKRHGIDINSTEYLRCQPKMPRFKGVNIEEHFMEIGKEQIRPYKDLLIPLVELKSLPIKPKKISSENGLIFDVEVCMSEGASAHFGDCSGLYELVLLEELISLGPQGPKLVIGHNVSYDRARLKEQYLIEDTKVRFLDTMSLHVCVSGVTSYQRALMKSKKDPAPEDIEWLSQSSLNSLSEVHRLYCGGPKVSKEERNIFVEGTLYDVREDFQNLMNYCSNDVAATHRILQKLFPLFEERFPHPVTLAGMLEMGSAYLPVNKNWLRYINESDLAYEDLSIEAKYHLARRADEACSLLKDEQYKNHLWLWDEDWSTQELKMKTTKTKTKSKSNPPQSLHDSKLSAEDKELYKEFQHLYDLKDQLPARRPLLPGYPAWYRKLCQKPPNIGSLTDWSPGPTEISTGMQIAPKLLSLCWEGYPLHYSREHGWGFLVPFTSKIPSSETDCENKPRIPIEKLAAQCPIPEFAQTYASELESDYAFGHLQKELDSKLGKREFYNKLSKKDHTGGLYNGSGVWCNQILDGCCFFIKLPHKNGKSLRVGNPLSRDFLSKFADNVLSSAETESSTAKRVIEIARMMSYWRNNRDRIIGQLVVWLNDNELPENLRNQDYKYGAICPQVVTCGTLTRRAMEPTWMTASNSQLERIGSELRAMVQAPPNYRIVGADVDSQELWIASVLGDAYAYGIHGATPLGWMTLSGTKSNGTDMHSITAKAVGISRDHAKVINYARIYGAGQNFAEGLLKQFNPTFSATEARSKAMKMFAITKGKKVYQLKDEFKEEFEDRSYTGYEALKLASSNNKAVDEMFERPCWLGGTESAMFNRLEEIATRDEPVTPFLGCRLSRALETNNTSDENRFLPTRINWVVQSGAVDFLHLMLVCMRWLLGDKSPILFKLHDELRYLVEEKYAYLCCCVLVEEKYAYQAALAMHITNLLTRSFCSSRLGLKDLPMSVAFFSSVEIDSVLRKECTMDCKTPSNPHGLNLGYGIPAGESLNIYDAIEKAGGNDLTKWEWIK